MNTIDVQQQKPIIMPDKNQELLDTHCTKCGSKIQEQKPKRNPDDRDYEIMLDLYSSGWHNRQITAIALYDALSSIERYSQKDVRPEFRNPIEPRRAQKILRAKIFSEYIAQLEAFGMLCVAIKNRNTYSFAWSLSNTKPSEVVNFYHGISKNPPKSLVSLMKFPQISKFNAFSKKFPDIINGLAYPKSEHDTILQHIGNIAKEYTEIDGRRVKLYNKFKHGFLLMDGGALSFWDVPTDKVSAITDVSNDVLEFTSIPDTQDAIDSEIQSIIETTKVGSELMALCMIVKKMEKNIATKSE